MDQRLAIDGGMAAVTTPIPTWPPDLPEIRNAIQCALDDGSWGLYHGRPLDELIETLRQYLGVGHVWPCSSGTIAVELALRGGGIVAGDEVILAGYDFPGNFRAIEAIGATAALVDVKADAWVLDPNLLMASIADNTRAVIVSHLHGQLADISTIRSSCAERDILVLEDACQAPGAVVAGRPAGTGGDVGTFSFGGSKLLSAGRGGAVVTEKPQILQRIKVFAERGNDAFPLSQLQASVLVPQINKLDSFNRQRLSAAEFLREQIGRLDSFQTPSDRWSSQEQPAFYKFPVRLNERFHRDTVIAALQAEGVPVDVGFRGFVLRSSRRCRHATTLNHSRRAAEQTMLLHHPVLLGNQENLNEIVEAFRKVDQWLAVDRA